MIVQVVPKAAPAVPWARSPKRGPPAASTVSMPCSRPRMSSGAAVCSTVWTTTVAVTAYRPVSGGG